MAHEKPPCFFITAGIGELRVNRGVLNVGVSEPILNESKFGTGV
jgi:hypothetical protein